jgi:hypothetical protein
MRVGICRCLLRAVVYHIACFCFVLFYFALICYYKSIDGAVDGPGIIFSEGF